jgi:hypothetical protein
MVGLSIHDPDGGVDAAADHLRGRTRPLSRPPRTPNDVVQATRLPFDPGSPTAGCAIRDGRRPTWRSFGARASRTSPKIGRQKPKLMTSLYSVLRAGGVFLPQAGPRFDLVFLKLSITSVSYRSVTSRNDEGDPVGRPRLARNAARNLACTPPSEGMENIELEPGVAVRPGRDRRGWGRSGGIDRGVGRMCHELWRIPPQRRIEHRDELRKGFNERNRELIPCRSRKCPRIAEPTMLRGGGALCSAARGRAQPRAAGSGVGAGS